VRAIYQPFANKTHSSKSEALERAGDVWIDVEDRLCCATEDGSLPSWRQSNRDRNHLVAGTNSRASNARRSAEVPLVSATHYLACSNLRKRVACEP
jgi:hypothetical protein